MSARDTPGPLSADVLHALVEQSLELIAVTDIAGTIAWANARFRVATGVSSGAAAPLPCPPSLALPPRRRPQSSRSPSRRCAMPPKPPQWRPVRSCAAVRHHG